MQTLIELSIFMGASAALGCLLADIVDRWANGGRDE